jgi:hypothetical protein
MLELPPIHAWMHGKNIYTGPLAYKQIKQILVIIARMCCLKNAKQPDFNQANKY